MSEHNTNMGMIRENVKTWHQWGHDTCRKVISETCISRIYNQCILYVSIQSTQYDLHQLYTQEIQRYAKHSMTSLSLSHSKCLDEREGSRRTCQKGERRTKEQTLEVPWLMGRFELGLLKDSDLWGGWGGGLFESEMLSLFLETPSGYLRFLECCFFNLKGGWFSELGMWRRGAR